LNSQKIANCNYVSVFDFNCNDLIPDKSEAACCYQKTHNFLQLTSKRWKTNQVMQDCKTTEIANRKQTGVAKLW